MNKKTHELEDAVIALLNKYVDAEEEQVKTWEEHAATVKKEKEKDEETIIDLSQVSLVEKLGEILHEVTNEILVGSIRLETGQETYALAKAIEVRESLRTR